jgi:hypothetical protein
MDKKWHYRCFDRILLKGLLQPFQQPERVVGFFNTYRSPRMAEQAGSHVRAATEAGPESGLETRSGEWHGYRMLVPVVFVEGVHERHPADPSSAG